MRGLFVTGTGTGVGKTVVAAALLCRYRTISRTVYWKPVQTGIETDDDTTTVKRLASAGPDELFDRGIRLARPVSPHLAAELADVRIAASAVAGLPGKADDRFWIVEGAGGVLVPLNESETMADLMFLLALPVVVVAHSTLGTINHTLLTLEALRRRDIAIAGVILVGDRNVDNRKAIERFGAVSVLAEMPHFDPLTPEALETWARNGFAQLPAINSAIAPPGQEGWRA